MYTLANDDQARECVSQAGEWFYEKGGRTMFEDVAGVARSAVAEYIANQKGLTLYAGKVKS